MSIVRENLLTRKGYAPYCGSDNCILRMPRMRFDGEQFKCRCGYRTNFEPEFIEKVIELNNSATQQARGE